MTTESGGSTARCEEMRVLLSGLADGMLDHESEETVGLHLATCTDCRRTRTEIEELSRGLHEAGRVVPAPPSWESVRRFVDRGDRSRGSGSLASPSTSLPPGSTSWPPMRPVVPPDGAIGRLSAENSGGRGFPSARGVLRGVRRPLVAAAAAAVLIGAAGAVGGIWLRAARRGAPVDHAGPTAAALTPEILDQILDPGRAPDFRRVGTARAVFQNQLSALSEEVSFTPIAPASLPGGYRFDQAWLISSKACQMLCLRYGRDGKYLAVLQSASGGVAVCALSNPTCCLLGGLACRRSRGDRVEVVQTTRGDVALTVAVPAGQTDLDPVMASLAREMPLRID